MAHLPGSFQTLQAPWQSLSVSVNFRVALGHRQAAPWLRMIIALDVGKAFCRCLVGRFHSDPTRGRRGQWSTSPQTREADRIWQSLQAHRLQGWRAVSCTTAGLSVETLLPRSPATRPYPPSKHQPAALLGAPPLASLMGHGGPGAWPVDEAGMPADLQPRGAHPPGHSTPGPQEHQRLSLAAWLEREDAPLCCRDLGGAGGSGHPGGRGQRRRKAPPMPIVLPLNSPTPPAFSALISSL